MNDLRDWIDLKIREPDEGTEVLSVNSKDKITIGVIQKSVGTTYEKFGNYHVHLSCFTVLLDITHWMSKPKPPKR